MIEEKILQNMLLKGESGKIETQHPGWPGSLTGEPL